MRYFFVSFTFNNGKQNFSEFTMKSGAYPSKKYLEELMATDAGFGAYWHTILNIQELSEQDYLDFTNQTSDGK